VAARITDYGVQNAIKFRLQSTDFSQRLLSLVLRTTSKLAAGMSEKYAWLMTIPSMREWIKERLIHDAAAFDFNITNKKYEDSLKIPLDLIKNDKIQECNRLIDSIGMAYPLWIQEMVATLINSAASALSFDGVAFFATTHKFGNSGTFSNDINSATNVAPATATAFECALAIAKGIETLRALPDDQGRKIKNEMMKEVTVVYQAGTVNAASLAIASSQQIMANVAGAVANPLIGLQKEIKINFVSSGLINDTTLPNVSFAIFRSAADLGSPFVFQENEDERMVSMITDPNSEFVVKNDAWLAAIKAVGNAGYGLPNDAVRVTLV
jgi:phage major head subunit gpT-like protein